MKTTTSLSAIIATALLCGCTESEKPSSPQPVRVATIEAKATATGATPTYPGTIEAASTTPLSFAVGGTVSRLTIEEGQTVSRGQLIGTVDDTTLRNAHTTAKAMLTQAEDAYNRMRHLHEAGSLSEMQWVEVQSKLDQARSMEQTAAKQLADARLTAPHGGYIARKRVEAGQNVLPGATVAELVDIDRVKASIAVPEGEVSTLGVGSTVTVSVDALGGRTFTGRVVERAVKADPLSRSYTVKALLENRSHELLPGMLCAMTADTAHAATAIILPATAVLIDADSRPFVWTAENGKATRRYVTIRGNAGSNVIVSGGLQSGAKVIAAGQQKISEGTEVKN